MNDRLPLPPLPLLDGTTLQVSASTLSTMQACPMMAAWKLLWGRERSGDAISAAAGKAFHAALQARSETRQAAFTDDLMAKATAAIESAYEAIDVPPDDHRTAARMSEVLRAYRETYPTDPWQVLATELPFAVPLGEVRIHNCDRMISQDCTLPGRPPYMCAIQVVYRGLIDLLVRWDDQVFIVDRKTSADWSPMTLNRYRNSAQFRSYAWVVQELHRTGLVPELPPVVHGAAVDAIVIRKPTTTTRAKLPREEFHRERFYYDQATLDEWRTNALGLVKSWLQQYADGRFVMNDNTCANYYGRSCGYLPVCELPAVDPDGKSPRLIMLSTDHYQDKQPGPLDAPVETAP